MSKDSMLDSNYDNVNLYKKDCLGDIDRWVSIVNSSLHEYASEKYYYEQEKKLKQLSQYKLQYMASYVADFRNMYKDIRMGVDWFVKKFEYEPTSLVEFKKKYTLELTRLIRIRRYLINRSRQLTMSGLDNRLSRNMSMYLKIKISIIRKLVDTPHLTRNINNNIIPISHYDD